MPIITYDPEFEFYLLWYLELN